MYSQFLSIACSKLVVILQECCSVVLQRDVIFGQLLLKVITRQHFIKNFQFVNDFKYAKTSCQVLHGLLDQTDIWTAVRGKACVDAAGSCVWPFHC